MQRKISYENQDTGEVLHTWARGVRRTSILVGVGLKLSKGGGITPKKDKPKNRRKIKCLSKKSVQNSRWKTSGYYRRTPYDIPALLFPWAALQHGWLSWRQQTSTSRNLCISWNRKLCANPFKCSFLSHRIKSKDYHWPSTLPDKLRANFDHRFEV